jgi:hypothetical protein
MNYPHRWMFRPEPAGVIFIKWAFTGECLMHMYYTTGRQCVSLMGRMAGTFHEVGASAVFRRRSYCSIQKRNVFHYSLSFFENYNRNQYF